MYEDDVIPTWIFSWQYLQPCLFRKKNQIPKILSTWILRCQSVNKILRFCTGMYFAPYKFWRKYLRRLIFVQTIVFHPYFMEINTLISIWLQLSRNGSSKLLKIFIKSISFAILSYHYGFFKKFKIFVFSWSASFYWLLWSQKRWRAYLKWKMKYMSLKIPLFHFPNPFLRSL